MATFTKLNPTKNTVNKKANNVKAGLPVSRTSNGLLTKKLAISSPTPVKANPIITNAKTVTPAKSGQLKPILNLNRSASVQTKKVLNSYRKTVGAHPTKSRIKTAKLLKPDKRKHTTALSFMTYLRQVSAAKRRARNQRALLRELRQHPKALFTGSNLLSQNRRFVSTIYLHAVENVKRQNRILFSKSLKNLYSTRVKFNRAAKP